MKINKLLFFLLALASLNSCVEYVDNGKLADGPEKPEELKYTAVHANPEDAKYIGDDFEFKAMLNNVDVTSTTKFKVNGTEIKGNIYVPHKIGSHSVIATMDNFTATFKFTVLEKDEEPEPTGNRIDYDGKSYEVKTTLWLLNTKTADNQPYAYNVTLQDGSKVLCTRWMMVSTSATNITNLQQVIDSDYYYVSVVHVPVKSDNSVAFPDETTTYLYSGNVKIDTDEFVMEDVEYVFNAVTDTNADYEGEALLDNTKVANLFWNGPYIFSTVDLGSKPKKSVLSNTNKMEFISKNQIKNLKIAK